MKSKTYAELYTEEGELGNRSWDCYPRPQLRREGWISLNGTWDFCANTDECEPEVFSEEIVVPFAPESLLSGIHRTFSPDIAFWYRKTFSVPADWTGGRILLHFGAVDQIARVWLNGRRLGMHTGGYAPFTFDITDHLQDENQLLVHVTDALDEKLPHGKQRRDRGGMWYTPVSGIWQTVWLEFVPYQYVKSINITTVGNTAFIDVDGIENGSLTLENGATYPLRGGSAEVTVEDPVFWSPKQPKLYHFTLESGQDRVWSYFALRTVTAETVNGIHRICLNGKPIFLHGLLDQGYWSDGLFLPASPDGFAEDIRAAKTLGYNTLRKHIKVEAPEFYYQCDKLGMLVIQDMVNCGEYNFLRDTALPTIGLKRLPDRLLHRDPTTRENFLQSMEETVSLLKNHPCIVCWSIFNEGWGQFNSSDVYRRLRALDDSRLIDTASGWFRGGASDLESPHVYFRPFRFKSGSKPVLLSEFGGYACKIPGHSFNLDQNYGYRFYQDPKKLGKAIVALYEKEIIPAVRSGLCGAIYTQLSDVEDETNGLITYDRRVCKVDRDEMQRVSDRLTDEINQL